MKRIALLLAMALLGGAAPPERVDLIIRGGTIYTGSDAPFVGDVAISGDRIRAVGPASALSRPARVIDARGMIVAPGFIDPHTHVGDQLADADARTRLIPAFLMQGVTTAFIGNDGGGDPDRRRTVLGSARRRPVGINYAAYVGFGAVRRAVIGDADRAPTPEELARMRRDGRGGDVPGRARPFDRPVLRAAKLRQDRRGRRARPRGRRARRRLRQPHARRILLFDRPRRGGGRGDHDRPRGASAGQHLPHQGARRRRPRPGAGDHRPGRGGARAPASRSPPINIPGRPRARASPRRWCRAGRMTAGGPPCCGASTIRRLAARLRADMAENLRRRGGAGSLLITEGQYRGRTARRGRPRRWASSRSPPRSRSSGSAIRRSPRSTRPRRTSPPSCAGPG